ncbi:MAG: CpsD/CapB family tyrosine-protein kinase [Clostridia bacterium]|nr:CpsD/CapB family tyrosine-protein kinase [Clostridia bacterium]
MRTNLMFLLAQQNGKIVAFTSSNASEGKSTTSVNVAIAFSQLGGKVLVVDADLRRSSIHKKLRLENEDGISNVLAGFSEFSKAVQSINPNLDVLTAGPIPPNPSELLGSPKLTELFDKLREEYDYIIIDTPPLNVVTDALLIGPKTDGIILVVRDEFTPHDTVKRAIDAAEFANIKILGAVMNGANPKVSRGYTYRRYSYKYRSYGYGYGYGYGYRRRKNKSDGYGYGYGYGYNKKNAETADKKAEDNKDNK